MFAASSFNSPRRVRSLLMMSSQPTHRSSSAPVQSVASPAQSRRTLPARRHLFERSVDSLAKLNWHLDGLAIDCVPQQSGTFARQGAEQFIERVSELLYPLIGKSRRHRVDRNITIGKRTHDVHGAFDVFF